MLSSISKNSNHTGFGDFYSLYHKIQSLFLKILYNLSYVFYILMRSGVLNNYFNIVDIILILYFKH